MPCKRPLSQPRNAAARDVLINYATGSIYSLGHVLHQHYPTLNTLTSADEIMEVLDRSTVVSCKTLHEPKLLAAKPPLVPPTKRKPGEARYNPRDDLRYITHERQASDEAIAGAYLNVNKKIAAVLCARLAEIVPYTLARPVVELLLKEGKLTEADLKFLPKLLRTHRFAHGLTHLDTKTGMMA